MRPFSPNTPARSLVPAWVDPLILTALGAWLVRLSWSKWVNIMVDFGRELYTPWRIMCGDVLYRDVASLFGPLPPYWNALLFSLFGPSIHTLAVFNIGIIALITFLLYRFFQQTANRCAGLLCAAAFLCVFAFKQHYYDQGNRAFVCPYSYSVTYAFFLSLCAVAAFAAYCRRSSLTFAGMMGLCTGLVALCRFEIWAALLPALVLGLALKAWIAGWPASRVWKAGALFCAGMAIPIGIAYAYFASKLPGRTAWESVLGYNAHWPDILKNFYYQSAAGLDQPMRHVRLMFSAAASYAVILVSFRWICVGTTLLEQGRRGAGILFISGGLASLQAVMFAFLFTYYTWAFYGLPVFVLTAVGWLLWRAVQQWREKGADNRTLPLLVMSVWAAGMLAKIVLKVQIYDVGFVYAAPAVLLLVAALTTWVPAYYGRVYHKERLIRTAGILICVFMFTAVLKHTFVTYQARTVRVEAGRDVIIGNLAPYSSVGATAVGEFLREVPGIIGPEATFVVFPEGIMLNYLMKRPSPVPYVTFMPAELIAFGEPAMLHSLQQASPRYIVYTNRSLYSFGFLGPGIDYARDTARWIFMQYRPVWHSRPDNGFVLTLLKLKDGT